ncbi:MAG: DUF423 domain-containing protein [Planctomycetes bacterium]|nr:DUF423 domain-containing protein [Planctomycetota bacterium]
MIRAGAFLGALGVALGAFGAHGLEQTFRASPRAAEHWGTATEYTFYHALALVLCGLLAERGYRPRIAAWCFAAGAVVFGGTLYLLALGCPRWLGAITPIGGTLLIAGWVALVVSRRSPASPDHS